VTHKRGWKHDYSIVSKENEQLNNAIEHTTAMDELTHWNRVTDRVKQY